MNEKPTPTRLSRGQKTLWAVVGTVAVLTFGLVFLIAAPVASGVVDPGFATVRVHEKSEGFQLYIPVPAVLLNAGLSAAASGGAFEHIGPLPEEAVRYTGVARAMLAELIDGPDATFVEVRDGDDHVVVAKRNGRFLVQVRSPDADVDVSVPARLALRVLDVVLAATPVEQKPEAEPESDEEFVPTIELGPLKL
jgi:hypothetical protein